MTTTLPLSEAKLNDAPVSVVPENAGAAGRLPALNVTVPTWFATLLVALLAVAPPPHPPTASTPAMTVAATIGARRARGGVRTTNGSPELQFSYTG
jgi:hypothetical protein